MRRSQVITVSIRRSFSDVYEYMAKPANFETWAAIEQGTFKPLDNGDWQGSTPFGFRHFRFTKPNPYGVLDHAIFIPGEEILYTPLRVVPNGEGTELAFTFFQRQGMDDDEFNSAAEWILTDFLALKSLLEARNKT